MHYKAATNCKRVRWLKSNKEKNNMLTLWIKKTTLNKVLKNQNKTKMTFPRVMGLKASQKVFTNEDRDRMHGRNYTTGFQCSVIKLSALDHMEELIPDSQKGAFNLEEGLEEVGATAASQDFPEVGEVHQNPCNLCDYTSGSLDNLTNHIGEEHPL